MLYAVDGVALGGWQLVDLGLMALVAIELLSLIFLKVVIILLGALLYATGPITIGLVATESGAAIARAWASAVVMLLALPVAWATLFAVGALLVGDAGTAGPLIAGQSSIGSLLGGVLLAVAGAASLWMCLRVAREAMGLLRMQLGGLLALSHRGSRAAARTDRERGAVELGELAAPFQRQRVPGGRRRRRSARGRRPGWRDGGARRPCGRLCRAPRRARDRRSGGPSGSGGSCAARSSARRSLARRRRGRSHGESRNRQLARRSAQRAPAQTCRSSEPNSATGAGGRRGRGADREQPATSRPCSEGAPAVASSEARIRREDSRPPASAALRRSADHVPGVASATRPGVGNRHRTERVAPPATQPTAPPRQVPHRRRGRGTAAVEGKR